MWSPPPPERSSGLGERKRPSFLFQTAKCSPFPVERAATRPPEEEQMNDQERQVISDIFQRLEQVASQPRDAEAERFIQDKVRQQPYAPYAICLLYTSDAADEL